MFDIIVPIIFNSFAVFIRDRSLADGAFSLGNDILHNGSSSNLDSMSFKFSCCYYMRAYLLVVIKLFGNLGMYDKFFPVNSSGLDFLQYLSDYFFGFFHITLL